MDRGTFAQERMLDWKGVALLRLEPSVTTTIVEMFVGFLGTFVLGRFFASSPSMDTWAAGVAKPRAIVAPVRSIDSADKANAQ